MSLGKFDRAIEIGNEIVANHPLMTERFTSNKSKPRTNLMHDLHSVEAKLDMNNTEGIFYTSSYPDVVGSVQIFTMRNGVPSWNTGGQGTDVYKRQLLILAAKITMAPCIRIQSMPYESARSYPNTFFSSEFFASILYLPLALVLNPSVFSKSACC